MSDNKMEILRLKIDEIDEKMILLLWDRMKIASQIGEIKKELSLPIIDLDRKKVALDKRLELARKIGLPEEEARELFEFLHTIAVRVQENKKN